MINQRRFYLFLVSVPVIAALAAAAGTAGIKTHFYLWEILIDGKTLFLAAAYYLILHPTRWRADAQDKGVLRWSFLKNLGAFVIPVVLSCAIAGAGLLMKTVSYDDPDNGATLLLTMVFDIPAIFIFSVTTVFIEEYVFRGTILLKFSENGRALTGVCISSIVWALYAIVDVFPLEQFTWVTMGILAVSYCAVGIASGVLYFASRSLWVSYAFRIGIITVTPSIIAGVTGMTDAFFSTGHPAFYGDGWAASLIMIAGSAVLFGFVQGRKKKQAREAVSAA